MKTENQDLIGKHLYIFNLSTDSDNAVLAFTEDWIKAFHEIVDDVSVFSTWVGRNSLPESVKVLELGGGSFLSRGKSIFRLSVIAVKIIRNRRNALVFHHMSTKTAAILGPAFRLFRIKQGLWYSHSNRPADLIISSRFMNRIFSSTPNSLPIKSKKARYVGHGIELTRYSEVNFSFREDAILSLGRIAKIKNNEILIDAVSRSGMKTKEVHLVGPVGKSGEYLDDLHRYAASKEVKLTYLGEIPHADIAKFLCNYSICYSGNPNTVDKSVIEGALSGCFTLANQKFILHQTGMESVLEELEIPFSTDLAVQIRNLNDLTETKDLTETNNLRQKLRIRAAEKNSLSNTTQQIIQEILMS
jgi:glycosyltransferase involved in cell wall biosynthesis